MSEKKTFHSLDDLKEVFHEEIEKTKTFKRFGIPYEIEDFDTLEIIEQGNNYIKIKDNKNNKTICSILHPTFCNVRFNTENLRPIVYYGELKDNVVCEYYYSLKDAVEEQKNFTEMDCNTRYKEENLILKRAYRNVDTKYGTFCLCIEQSKKLPSIWNNAKSVAVYHGKAQDILENGFIEPTSFTVFKNTNYMNNICYKSGIMNTYNIDILCSNFSIGLEAGGFKQHRWMYKNVDQKDYGIYSSEKPIYSVIIEKGKLDKNSPYYAEDLFYFINKYAPSVVNSKKNIEASAYFHDYRSILAVEKDDKDIHLILKDNFQNQTGYSSLNFHAKNKGCFSIEEMDTIIAGIKTYIGNFKTRDGFFEKVINEFDHYKQIKECDYKSSFDFENPYHYQFNDFNQAVFYLKDPNLSHVVENMIEKTAQVNHVSTSELLGDSEQIKENIEKVKVHKKQWHDKSGVL